MPTLEELRIHNPTLWEAVMRSREEYSHQECPICDGDGVVDELLKCTHFNEK